MVQTALSDVTLTMIVRDELMNCAGGLLPMLEYHLPHFPAAVVLDTGSVDGTRQLLEHLQGEYPQLKVYDAEFEGYGYARLKANSLVLTEYSFMLDADERLAASETLAQTWNRAKERGRIKHKEVLGANITLTNVYLNGAQEDGFVWNPRLARCDKVSFTNLGVWEYSTLQSAQGVINGRISAFHFLPYSSSADYEMRRFKMNGWYDHLDEHISRGIAPSQARYFHRFKTPNAKVLQQFNIDVYAVLHQLEGIGLRPQQEILEILEKEKRNGE